ncbi:hypothetical protein [Hoylesella marshii]|nr:hypothetical protein [Hoylesella marshii]
MRKDAKDNLRCGGLICAPLGDLSDEMLPKKNEKKKMQERKRRKKSVIKSYKSHRLPRAERNKKDRKKTLRPETKKREIHAIEAIFLPFFTNKRWKSDIFL